MKSNTLLFSSLKANSKLSMHCSHLMICRKKKKKKQNQKPFWRNYSRSRNGFRESLLQIAPKISIIIEHVSFPQRLSIKTWKPNILWAKPKNVSAPFGQKPGRVFGLFFFTFFPIKSGFSPMGDNPDLLTPALKSTGIIYSFLSPCWQSQVSMFLSQLQNFWYFTEHGNLFSVYIPFYCLLPSGGQLSVR